MARSVDLQIFTKDGEIDFDPVKAGAQEAHVFCRRFEITGTSPIDHRTGTTKGTREYAGIKIEKRLDKASPKLVELFVNNVGVKAVFQIHRTNSGTDYTPGEVAMTVTVGAPDYKAWISSYRLIVPDVEKQSKDDPDEPYEEVIFSFTTVEFHKSGTGYDGKQHEIVVQDDVTAQK